MWCLTVYLFWPRRNQRTLNQSEGLLIRLFAINFSAGLTVQVNPIAEARDRLVGVNNLSWFVGYTLCILGAYFGLLLWLRTSKLSIRRGTVISIGTLLLLVLLFPALAADQETSHDTLFIPPAVLAFCTTVYLWVALTAQEVMAAMRRLRSQEELATGQLRIAIAMFAVNCGRAFVLVRSLILILVFFIQIGLGLTRQILSPIRCWLFSELGSPWLSCPCGCYRPRRVCGFMASNNEPSTKWRAYKETWQN